MGIDKPHPWLQATTTTTTVMSMGDNCLNGFITFEKRYAGNVEAVNVVGWDITHYLSTCEAVNSYLPHLELGVSLTDIMVEADGVKYAVANLGLEFIGVPDKIKYTTIGVSWGHPLLQGSLATANMNPKAPIIAPALPEAADIPWHVDRSRAGNISAGTTNVVAFGPKLAKKNREAEHEHSHETKPHQLDLEPPDSVNERNGEPVSRNSATQRD
ncbi:hypothetical protein LXL04_023047 [Taraxacum kok-saghyz]